MKNPSFPDSDETARRRIEFLETELEEQMKDLNVQTSTKSGKHSSVEKLGASRPEYGPSPGFQPVAGAAATEAEVGTAAEPRFHCNACGRWFDMQVDLNIHETECRLAKEATAEGRSELAKEDSEPHPGV